MAEPRSLAIDEIGGWSLLQLAGWPATMAPLERTLAAACGFAVPAAAGEVARQGALALIRTGPDRFWLVDDEGRNFAGRDWDPTTTAVTPLGEGRVRLRLTGSRVGDVLARCVALDWHNPRLAPGRAAETMVHRVPVLIWRTEADIFDLFTPRSFALATREWLADTAAGLG